MPRQNNKSGFTLIELIIVIVIIGVLAAVAIPKYINLSSAARAGAARGIGGAMSSSVSMMHANYLVHGTSYSMNDVVSNTDFSGGITSANLNTDTANVINLNFQGSYFIWDYTPRSNNTTAYITESTASPSNFQ